MKGLSKAKFAKWLKSKNPRTKVGSPEECYECPLAKFLVQTTGKYVSVEDAVIYTETETPSSGIYRIREHFMPPWAQKFVAAVDNQGTQSVSAAKCLSLLAEIR